MISGDIWDVPPAGSATVRRRRTCDAHGAFVRRVMRERCPESVLVCIEVDGPHVPLQECVADEAVDADAAEVEVAGRARNDDGTLLDEWTERQRVG